MPIHFSEKLTLGWKTKGREQFAALRHPLTAKILDLNIAQKGMNQPTTSKSKDKIRQINIGYFRLLMTIYKARRNQPTERSTEFNV